jgi:membrane protein YdbS with pleckstrin-like domain
MNTLKAAKRLIIISAVVWLIAVAVGSYIDIRNDSWWAHVGVGIMRGLPLGFMVLGVLAYQDIRRHLTGRCELEHRAKDEA